MRVARQTATLAGGHGASNSRSRHPLLSVYCLDVAVHAGTIVGHGHALGAFPEEPLKYSAFSANPSPRSVGSSFDRIAGKLKVTQMPNLVLREVGSFRLTGEEQVEVTTVANNHL